MFTRHACRRLGSLSAILLLFLLLALPALVAADTIVLADQASCEALGGTWNALSICVLDSLTVDAGDSLFIEDTLYVQFTGELTVSGALTNSGILDVIGRLSVGDGARVENRSLLTIRPFGVLDNEGRVDNKGQISNGGAIINLAGIIDNQCQGVLFGSGSFIGETPLNSPGSLACTEQTTYLPHVAR